MLGAFLLLQRQPRCASLARDEFGHGFNPKPCLIPVLREMGALASACFVPLKRLISAPIAGWLSALSPTHRPFAELCVVVGEPSGLALGSVAVALAHP